MNREEKSRSPRKPKEQVQEFICLDEWKNNHACATPRCSRQDTWSGSGKWWKDTYYCKRCWEEFEEEKHNDLDEALAGAMKGIQLSGEVPSTSKTFPW